MAVLAVRSGQDAHGPVERIPGVRQAVTEHEEAGEWARDVFLVVALLEIAALVARRKSINVARVALWGSAVAGIAGGLAIVKTAGRGGDLVYNYAGGVGIRAGDTAAVTRLYLAGLYQAALQARTQKDSARAAMLFTELERQFPNDTTVKLLAIESQLRDKRDEAGIKPVNLKRLVFWNAAAGLVVLASILPAYVVSSAHPPDRAMATNTRVNWL